jgi:hypothetical protein
MMFLLYVLLTFLALVMLGWASPARGRTLWLTLLLFGWTISQFNTLIEAVAFAVMPLRDAVIQLGVALIAFAILAALAVTCVRKWRGPGAPPARIHVTAIGIVAVVLGYQLLYFGAGTFVWPFVADYYLAKGLPPQGLVAALQVPRALIFALPALLWLRTGPKYAAFALGAAFAIMGGIAPMLPDNPYMPAPIRLAHGIETGSSNFLFGLLIGWLFRRREAAG